MYYKQLIILLISTLILTSCQSNKIYIERNPKLYDKQLKDSLSSKNFKNTKYILEHAPRDKTLNYYKYLVKYYYLTDSLDTLEKISDTQKNEFVKSYLKGLIFSAKGVYYFDDSLKMFYNALKYKKLYTDSISELYYNIAVIEIKKENYKNSIKNINNALKIEEDGKYIVLKSYILMKQGKYNECKILLNNSFNKILKSKNLIKAISIMNFSFDSLRPMPKKLKEAYARWLSVAQTGKHLQTVLTVAKEGMRDYPEYSEMYTLAGLASYLLDNKSEAVVYFTKAIEIDKNRPFNYIQMGVIYWNLKQYLKAEEFFIKSLKMNKFSPIIYAYLSLLEKKSENFKKAVEYKESQIRFGRNLNNEMDLVALYKNLNLTTKTKKLLEGMLKRYPNSKKPYKELVTLYDTLIEEEPNPDLKLLLRKKQIAYQKLYMQKDEEESKRRLVTAEIESNDEKKK